MTVIGRKKKMTNNHFEEMLTLREVKKVLGVSYGILIEMIRNGELEAHKVTGRPITKEELSTETYGLRIPPESLRDFIEYTVVK